jgi:hypothetical protein
MLVRNHHCSEYTQVFLFDLVFFALAQHDFVGGLNFHILSKVDSGSGVLSRTLVSSVAVTNMTVTCQKSLESIFACLKDQTGCYSNVLGLDGGLADAHGEGAQTPRLFRAASPEASPEGHTARRSSALF